MATLADLMLRVRQRADMVNSTFIDDSTELTPWINQSYSELYDLLVSRFEDYYSQSEDFTLSNSNERALPANFYKLRGLDFSLDSSKYVGLEKWNFDERNSVSNAASDVAGNYRLWFIPRFTPLVNPNDVLGDVLDFEEYIIVDSAIKALNKEESDVSVLLAAKTMLKQRIEAMGSNRDTRPDRIVNVHRMSRCNGRKYRVMGNTLIVVRSLLFEYSDRWY